MKIEKALVTGAGGFIGSHLAELCVEQGYKVRAFVHYNSRNQWGWLEKSEHRAAMEIVSGDIRDFDVVSSAMDGCDTVFHLAALIGIPYSYVSPLAYMRVNIEGTYNILQSARIQKVRNILVTSTSETYGTAQYVPMDEAHPVVGQSPYSATKIAADQLAVSYHRSFDMPVKIVRPFNTYGPRQSARAVIPTTIIQIIKGVIKLKLGNLEPTRDLTYVQDTVRGFLEIAKSDALFGEVTNIGNGREISIRDLVLRLAKLMNRNIEIDSEMARIRPKASEVERLFCNPEKLMRRTNWNPAYSLDDGLAETIEWLKNNQDLYKHDLYNV
jgi:NAD dependent epimerase/dehydratase